MSHVDPAAIGAEIETLIGKMGALGDSQATAQAQELVRLLMSLYGAGLSRMLDIVRTEGGGPQAVLERCATDPLLASLLVLHDLHPHPIEVRLQRALNGVRPHLPDRTHLRLVAADGDSVRVIVEGPAVGSSQSGGTIRLGIERAIQEAAPEIGAVHIDGLDGPPSPSVHRASGFGEASGLIQIIRSPQAPAPPPPAFAHDAGEGCRAVAPTSGSGAEAGGPRPRECCELCGAPLSDEHGHSVDIRTRRLLCTCMICGLGGLVSPKPQGEGGGDSGLVSPKPRGEGGGDSGLVSPKPRGEGGGEGGPYRVVPARYVHLPSMKISPAQWDALAIPVDLAFFFVNSHLSRTVACYPGPAGAAESLLPLEAWPALVDANPWIQAAAPDVEALLVRRIDEEYRCFLVPIDACYELVGRIRTEWTGLGGGDRVRREIDRFFATIINRSSTSPQASSRHAEVRP